MKMNYEKAMEVNNNIKLNVDKQQEDIKHLKEQWDIDDEDEVQEITADSTPMKKNKPVCVICYQTFAMTNWFKKHIQEEHMIPCKLLFPLWAY